MQEIINGANEPTSSVTLKPVSTLIEVNGECQNIYATPLRIMMDRVKSEPKMKMVYSGIRENSVGFIFGQSKSAKTIYCENLGMSIAAGLPSYLTKPINSEKRKVLFISLEEFYTGRTERNTKQAAKLSELIGNDSWLDNYIVVNENMPRYLATDEDWKIIQDTIQAVNPGIVFLDSLSRLYEGSIEDSRIGKEVMKRLRELSHITKTTIAAIHHTPKLYNSPLTINAIAGSRILAQDADFMIGLNKTIDGKRYIKEVAFRYAPEDCDIVKMFTISDDLWLNISGDIDEATLLAAYDGRRDDVNKLKICDFIAEKGGSDNSIVSYREIEEKFVKTSVMSGQTAHSQLNKLIQEGKIIKQSKGQYKSAA